jgi:hypothetical protein
MIAHAAVADCPLADAVPMPTGGEFGSDEGVDKRARIAAMPAEAATGPATAGTEIRQRTAEEDRQCLDVRHVNVVSFATRLRPDAEYPDMYLNPGGIASKKCRKMSWWGRVAVP